MSGPDDADSPNSAGFLATVLLPHTYMEGLVYFYVHEITQTLSLQCDPIPTLNVYSSPVFLVHQSFLNPLKLFQSRSVNRRMFS